MKSFLALCLVICALDSTFGEEQCPQEFFAPFSDSWEGTSLNSIRTTIILTIHKNVRRNGMCDVYATAEAPGVSQSPPKIKNKRQVPCDRDYCTIFCLEIGGDRCGQNDYSYYTG